MRKDLVGNIAFSPFFGNNFFKDFDKVFEEAFRPLANASTYPPMNIYVEKDEKLVFEVALAGFSRDEVKVEVEKNVLHISSDKKDDALTWDRKYVKHKIARREFKLAYVIPDVYDVDVPIANFDGGILTVSFTKKEVAKPERKLIELG